MKSYEKSEKTSAVPWAMLLEEPKGPKMEPGWLCEVSCALGSVQTGESDALRQWYQRWQKQSQRTSQAKASSFHLKSTRGSLREMTQRDESLRLLALEV